MTAVEFIKKHGWGMVNDLYKKSEGCDGIRPAQGGYVKRDELKPYIEAYELVQTGLPELKKSIFNNSIDVEYVKNWLLAVSDGLLTEKAVKLKQAIKLVEEIEC